MQENNSCGKFIYMDGVQGPEKANDTCVNTMHVGTMDRGFTVAIIYNDMAWNTVCIFLELD
jgi:hypothetical protein